MYVSKEGSPNRLGSGSIYRNGGIEPDTEKLNKALDATVRLLIGQAWNTARLQPLLEFWNWSLLLLRRAMSILQKWYDLESDEKLAVPTASARRELQLMVVALQLYASMRRCNAVAMFCGDAHLIGGAKLYTDFVKRHPSQSKVVVDFRNQLSRK